MEELEITHVQTAVRGRKAEVSMEIEEVGEGQYTVKCPYQSVISEKARKRHKACFDVKICKECPLSNGCSAKEQGDKRTDYFDRSDYLLSKRNRNIKSLPPERRKLRPNVEATVKEFSGAFNHKGKLRVRGLFRTMVYAYSMAVSINFGRIWRYIADNPEIFAFLKLVCGKLRCLFAMHCRNMHRRVTIQDESCCWREPVRYFARAA
jgi:hypothetical protein